MAVAVRPTAPVHSAEAVLLTDPVLTVAVAARRAEARTVVADVADKYVIYSKYLTKNTAQL